MKSDCKLMTVLKTAKVSITLLATVLLGLGGPKLSAADRPNVLFIAVDDLVTTLGCYGDTTALTPNIDSLASQGTTFLNHHVQWAVCGPSRAALTTSLMPEETNVMGFKKIRDKNYLPDVITLPQHFRNNGYETACTGKFHDNRTVGTPVEISATYPDGVMDNGHSVDDPASWSVPYVNAGSGFSTPTKVAVDSTDQPDSLYEDHKILTAGIALIDDLTTSGGSAPGNKPFFLAVGFKKPHLPFVAPKAYWDLYTRANMPLAAFTGLPADTTTYNTSTLLNNSEMLGGGDDTTNGYEPYRTDNSLLQVTANQLELIHGYYACVSFIDKLVGDLLTKLATTNDPLQPGKKLSETTIVVLWGDHGFHLGDHGRWAKHTAMDRATSSPLIIFDPRSPKNSTNNKTTSPAGTIDIYPTLCELACLPIPEQPTTNGSTTGRPLRGRSLVPVISNPASSVHNGVISQFNISGQYGYAYRTERFRYIEWVNSTGNMNDGNARRDLFDYQLDPLEAKNLANDPNYAAIVYQLSRSMRAETTVRGTGRLNLASPIATGGNGYVLDTTIKPLGGNVTLNWPASGGVSYDVLASPTLETGSWVTDFSSIPGPSKTFSIAGTRRFFRIGIGANTPPVFTADPVLKTVAKVGVAYSQSLAANASDANAGDTLTFSKVSGPAWLNVASNGSLSGTAAVGNVGANYFTVQIADSWANTATAELQITVYDPATNTAPSFSSHPVVKTAASVDTPYSGSLADDATDPDVGQTLVFAKTSGPSWLNVLSNGRLTGTPAVGNAGLNSFGVQVTDPLGSSDTATLEIQVNAPQPTITVLSSSSISGNSTYGSTGTLVFTNTAVQSGDIVVVAHGNNKNTSTNTISISGLGSNTIQSVNSGSSGTTSSAWVFYSSITAAGTYSVVLDTSNSTKSVAHATTLFVLRPINGGTLSIASTDGSVATSSSPATSLSLDFTMSPAVTTGYGIAAGAMNTSTFSGDPAGWSPLVSAASKRETWANNAINGSSLSVPFSATASTDMALAGIVVQITP
jgi:arylsulfatase A-like enzyme